MSTRLDQLEAQALQLSAEERSQLAERLITSLFEDHDIEAAWDVEIERRLAAIDNGAALIPADQAIARARSALK